MATGSRTVWVLVLVAGLGGCFAAGAPARAQDDDFGGLPAGEHRALVFGVCSGCHSVKMVMQNRMKRTKWDKTLDWMVEQQGMRELDPETESRILDYLAEHFGPETDGQRTDGGDGAPSPYNTMEPM